MQQQVLEELRRCRRRVLLQFNCTGAQQFGRLERDTRRFMLLPASYFMDWQF